MSTFFPGMDPYLEDPLLWDGVYRCLVVYLADQLQPVLGRRYVATVEERVYADDPILVHVPPLEIHESRIEILDLQSQQRPVTVIEIVTPRNKQPGPGRDSYLAKQAEICRGTAHLVEIDLLRTGQHVLAVPETVAQRQGPYHYLVSVNRARPPRDVFDLYPRTLRDRLPRIRIPLADDDPDVALDVQSAVARVHEAGRYADRINYGSPCEPPLAAEDQAWAQSLVHRP